MSAWKSFLPSSVKSSTGSLVNSGITAVSRTPQVHTAAHASNGESSASYSTHHRPSSPHRKRHRSPSHDPEHPPMIMIISLAVDQMLSDHITALRDRYFPKAINHLSGHVTLFHALPSEKMSTLEEVISSCCSSVRPFDIKLKDPVLRGGQKNKAVFIPFFARDLMDVHRKLLRGLKKEGIELSEQDDNERFWPHATVVNKVSPQEAEEVHEQLMQSGEATKLNSGQGVGLDMWYYKGGPWEHYKRFNFS